MASASGVSSIVERLRESANVNAVYGHPIETPERTVVPVASITYAFGGGYGNERDAGERAADEHPDEDARENSGSSGAGGGGAATAKPVGVVEIAEQGVRLHRFSNRRRSAAVFALGAIVGLLVARWRRD